MNIYKLRLFFKGFSFLDEILRKREEGIFHEGYENLFKQAISLYGKKIGFMMEKDEIYYIPSYLQNPEDIKVKRADENLLKITPSVEDYHGGKEVNSYFAVGSFGIVELDYWFNYDNDAPEVGSIGEQLYKLGLSPDYIVHRNTKEENGDEWLKIIIYKMNNFNLSEYHCEQIDKSARELKSEIHVTYSKEVE